MALISNRREGDVVVLRLPDGGEARVAVQEIVSLAVVKVRIDAPSDVLIEFEADG